jgi:hypothetical protein
MSVSIGKAREGGLLKYFKIVDGDNVYRILPPLGVLSQLGVWSRYYPLAWGYKDSSGKMIPFVDPSVRNRTNGMYDQMSAALERNITLKSRKDQLKEGGASEEQVGQMIELIKQFNIENKNYMFAVNVKGEIGVLKLGVTCYKALTGDRQTDDPGLLNKLGTNNPTTSLTGAFINFHRSGRGFNTQYTVGPYFEPKADGSFVHRLHTIDDNVKALLDSIGVDKLNLDTLYPYPSLEEVARIVSEGSKAVDEILGKSKSSNASSETPPDNSLTATTTVPLQKAGENTEVAVQPTEVAAATPEVKVEVAKAEATAAPSASTQPFATMSNEDFLKSMGVNV